MPLPYSTTAMATMLAMRCTAGSCAGAVPARKTVSHTPAAARGAQARKSIAEQIYRNWKAVCTVRAQRLVCTEHDYGSRGCLSVSEGNVNARDAQLVCATLCHAVEPDRWNTTRVTHNLDVP